MEGITPESSVNGLINKYKYSNEELQLEMSLNQYHFGARFYDPVTGRFNVIDPLADFAADYTPYRYAFDNPVLFTDRTGFYEEDYHDDDGPPGGFWDALFGGNNHYRTIPREDVEKSDNIKTGSKSDDENESNFNNQDGFNTTYDILEEYNEDVENDEQQDVYDGVIRNGWDFMYELNRFNPIANIVNAAMGYATGEDSYGVPISNTESTSLLLSSIPLLRIGKFVIPARTFHRVMKPEILKAAGNFEKHVGKNPDIIIEKGQIILKGVGPFKGKTFPTSLDPLDYFK
jgi:RHS repeat-associated protein